MIVAIVAVITFALIHLAPGDPFTGVMDNPNVSETVRQTLRAQYGLDRPLPEQFVKYVNALAHGELGWSFSHERPVREVLATALPNTLLLMVVALVGSFALGIVTALVQVALDRRVAVHPHGAPVHDACNLLLPSGLEDHLRSVHVDAVGPNRIGDDVVDVGHRREVDDRIAAANRAVDISLDLVLRAESAPSLSSDRCVRASL